MSAEKKLSCIDCAVANCNMMDREFPGFCLTTETVTEDDIAYVRGKYSEEENKRSMVAAACVEYEGYCQLTRVQEIMDYARRIGAKKLGIATCVGHDSLFYKYSDALVTTAVTKERVLGHNPVAALYTAEGYYRKKLFSEEKND